MFAKNASAATLYISPASITSTVGSTFTAKVLVNTNGAAINTANTTISFPKDLLSVTSIDTSSSIFSMWVESPKYSNLDGTVTFDGGLPNPGFTGKSGQILSITFKAKKKGVSSIAFADSAVRANDGLGTDVLASKVSSSVKITDAQNVVPDTLSTSTVATSTVSDKNVSSVIVSSTHPDQNKWYNTKDVSLTWDVPDDVAAVSAGLSKTPSTPKVVYNPPIANKEITDISDGVSYFNLRFKNKNGWGPVSSFKIQVDTVAPHAFSISLPQGSAGDDPRPLVSFKTTDDLSGIDHYEIKTDNSKFISVSSSTDINVYALPVQDPGDHTLLVKAVDKAGNETIQSTNFSVLPLNTPRLSKYPHELSEGESLYLRGTSYPLTSVEIILKDSLGGEVGQMVNVADDGTFQTMWANNLPHGTYTLELRAIDGRGAKSNLSEPVVILVKKSMLSTLNSFILNWLSLIILSILAIGGITFTIVHFIHKIRGIKKTASRK
ncbi:MAG: cohesin domain-containing protein [Candidatus Taylorbacteria bacterium]